MWRRPVPAEQAALDRPWRLWASVAVSAFVLVSVVLGFLLVPATEEAGFDPFAVICRAIGIPGFDGAPQPEAAALTAAEPPALAWTAEVRNVVATADPVRGGSLVAEICAACHGEQGIAVDPTAPHLAGQPLAALLKQLHDYQTGARRSDIMQPMVEGLDEQQLADAAAYYAAQPRIAGVPARDAVGPGIARMVIEGDPARAVPGCISCHEAGEVGPIGTPNLTRQRADYLHQQLQAFAEGTRANDIYGRMRAIAQALTPAEMRRLADYYSGQPAR